MSQHEPGGLRASLAARSPREQRLILLAALVVGLGLMLSLAEWVWSEQARLRSALPGAQATLARMQDDAAALSQLARQARPQSVPLATAARAAHAAGVSRGLHLETAESGNGITASGQGRFDAVIDWLASVQADQRLRLARVVLTSRDGSTHFEVSLTQ